MGEGRNIRNVSVLGYSGCGKTTLTRLLSGSGPRTIAEHGNDETDSQRIYSIDTSASHVATTALAVHAISHSHMDSANATTSERPQETQATKRVDINLIDTPGHLDHLSEVFAALRVTDGVLLVTSIGGAQTHTDRILRQILAERVKPVIVINMMDQVLLRTTCDKEALFQSLTSTIHSVNAIISAYHDATLGDFGGHPDRGAVAFLSGLHSWGFTIRQFARQYVKKFGVDEEKLMNRLWGDHFFNPKTRKWTTKGTADGQSLGRAFNMFILDPILKIVSAVSNHQKDETHLICQRLDLHLSAQEEDLEGESLIHAILRHFLPAKDALLDMITDHLPSPVVAQRYRVEMLYDGPMDDAAAAGIRTCDPDGPMVIHISKMVRESGRGGFFALGRIFSGSVKAGNIRIQGPRYHPGGKDDLFIKSITHVVSMSGAGFKTLEECRTGQIIGLAGIEGFLSISGTITDAETTHNIRSIKFSVPAIVQCSVDVVNPKDLPKLTEALKELSMARSSAQVHVAESGQHGVAGVSSSHLEGCIQELQGMCEHVPLRIGDQHVEYRETVQAKSSSFGEAFFGERGSRIKVSAQPIEEGLVREIEDCLIHPYENSVERAGKLVERYGWSVPEQRKIWCFGPDNTGPNLLVNATNDVPYLDELAVKNSFIAGFQWVAKAGVFAGEQMRGVQLNIMDVTKVTGTIRRSTGEIIPTTRRACYAACMLAQPGMQEPVYLVEIKCSEVALVCVEDQVERCRGSIVSKDQLRSVSSFVLTAHVPAVKFSGLEDGLLRQWPRDVRMQMIFDHWSPMEGSPDEEGSELAKLAQSIRKRKGLKEKMPGFWDYYDSDW